MHTVHTYTLTGTDIHTLTNRDRHTHKHQDTYKDRHTHTHADTYRDRHICTDTYRDKPTHTDNIRDRQTHTDTFTDKQTDKSNLYIDKRRALSNLDKIRFLKERKNLVFYPLLPPGYPRVSSKIFSRFGSAVWPSIANVYLYVHTYKYSYIYGRRALF